MTQDNDILQQLSGLSSDAKRALLTRLMQIQSQPTERWEPLSYNQQALWFHMHLAPESVAYNLLYSLRIFEAIDNAVLHRACQQLVQRYPILTATFVLHNEKPAQYIKAHQTIPIQEIDATTWSSDELQHEIISSSNQVIDVARGPLFRIVLFRSSSEETILAFIAHHIILDFWAFTILIDELFTLYSAAKTNSPVTLPPPAGQHNDYVQWQQTMLASTIGQQHWHYWQERLSSPLPILHLPTDHPHPPVQSYHGSTFELTLNQKLTQQLRKLASKEKVTLFTLLLTAYQTLIFRYTNQNDILIGIPTLGRDEATFERLIDDVTNPVIIRGYLTSDLSFSQLLRQTQQQIFQALEHQDYPFSLLVERLQPERNLSYSPLYQTTFTWDKPRHNTLSTLAGEPFIYGQQGTLFDLALTMFELDNELIASFRYDIALFEPETIEQLAHHFMLLLEGLVTQFDQPIQRIPLLTYQEQQQIVLDQNRTQTQLSHARSIQQLITEQAQLTPDALALTYATTTLTYGELNERANQVAHRLRREGIGPEVSVGICLERSAELIILLLGILKAEGSYIPLDPHYPIERITWILNDAQPAMVLTQKPLSTRLSTQARIYYLEDLWSEFALEETGNPTEITEPQQTAYIIYTSGSTGRPKGVMVSHHNVLNFFVGMDAILPAENTQSQKTWLAVTSISFDISVLELLWTLSHGFQVVLQPEQQTTPLPQNEPSQGAQPKEQSNYHLAQSQHEDLSVSQQLIRSGASYLQCTPSLMNMLLLLPETVDALHNLHHLLLGGEALPLALVKKLQKLTPATLHNMYGPTETTIWSSTSQLLPDSSHIVLGQPLANTQIYILDNELQPVPTGVAGELYISGQGVARGYLNRSDLTAERFLPNQWSRENGARMYRTGDLARYHAHGEIEYLGRIDHQIKLRGFRIELGEIEAVLQSHPLLQEAVVIVYSSGEADPYLVAYIVLREGAEVETLDLQTYLRAQVPDYMVPARFIPLSALPRTPNGKTDRQALPPPENAQTLSSATFVAPTTQLQIQLAELWAQTLHLTQVGITDNFFKLGGHSLAAVEITTQMHKKFQVVISLRDFFEAPTITALAQHIEQERRHIQEEEMRAALVIQSQARTINTFPLSFGQRRLWLLYKLNSEDVSYLIPTAIQLNGKLYMQALTQGLNAVIQRHELLRTIFPPTDKSEPVQLILPQLTLQINVVDISALTAQAREDALEMFTQHELQTPFDLEHGPLLRAHLLRIYEQEHILFFTMHHIISDGQKSAAILMQELSLYYRAELTGQPARLPDLPIQYADYAVWQRQQLDNAPLEKQLTYWRQQLEGSPALLELPTDYPRPALQTSAGALETLMFSHELTLHLQELSLQYNGTLFMTLLAAFQALLMRYSGQQDIAIGTPITDRGPGELEGLIGFFANTLVIRTDLSNNPGFLELAIRVKETLLQAYENRDLPFEQLVEALEVERSLRYTPLFQVLFAQQNPIDTRVHLNLPDITWTRLNLASTTAKFDLNVMITNQAEGLLTEIEYNTDLFKAETIQRMLGHWQTLLEGVVCDPQTKLSVLPLLTEAEHEQLLSKWNATQTEYPQEMNLPQYFMQQAARTPDAIALFFEDQQITYAELHTRSNQLGAELQARGVGPEMLVGVCLKRTPELVLALLSILKAGGAYVPLDPAYPEERLAFMLQDAQVNLLLTHTSLRERFPQDVPEILYIDREWSSRSSQEPMMWTGLPGQLAYVIYTSGSTGRPKGVMATHQATMNRLSWMWHTYPFVAGEVACHKTNLSFVDAVWEIFGPLLQGVPLMIMADDILLDPAHFLAQLERYAVTRMVLVPSLLRVVLAEGQKLQMQLRHLTTWICSGESLTMELAQHLVQLLPHARLLNFYGSSEVAADVTSYEIDPYNLYTPMAIGRPIANTQIYLLDANLQPVPVGVPGELCVGGENLARGYLNQADLTAERFIAHPFAQIPGARLYKTGDLARYRPDGILEYLGRIDQQTKIRGYRIEVGEIEVVLSTHPALQECTVVAREDVPGEKRLVTYVVVKTGETLTIDDLRIFLQERLPGYMLPTAFIFLKALPLTLNGKIDRRALPAPEQLRPELVETFVAPEGEVETLLATIWSNLLRVEQIGVHDNFFALGGDSILSIQVVSRARLVGLSLTPRQLFQYQTIAQLATVLTSQTDNTPSHLDRQDVVSKETALTPIQRLSDRTDAYIPSDFPLAQLTQESLDQILSRYHHISDIYPLSPIQEGMLFHSLYEKTSGTYIEQFSCIITGQLEQEIFEQAWQQLVMQHPILRTSFCWENLEEPLQIVWSQVSLPIESHNWQHYTSPQQQDQLETFLSDDRARGFDLQQAPLIRLTLLRLMNETTRMIWTYHHLLLDGWSLPLILQEVFDYYVMLHQTKVLQPIARRPYSDYIAWLQGQNSKIAETYWRQQLAGFKVATPLDIMQAAPTQTSSQDSSIKERYLHTYYHLSTEQTSLWRQHARHQLLTLNTLFQGAWGLLLAHYSRQSDILFGNVVSGRPPDLAHIEQMIGLFINTTPVRVQIPDSISVEAWLRQLQAQQAEQHQYEISSPIEIQGWSDVPRNRPLFESLLAFENYPLDMTLLNQQRELKITEISLVEQTNYPLVLTVSGTTELTLHITYDHQRFASEAIQRLMGHFLKIVEQFVENPRQPLAQISLLTTKEHTQQVYDWNDTAYTFSPDICLHQHIERQVLQQPDTIALRFEESQISYQELNAQANHLAARLQRHNVGPDTLVGVYMERSLEMVITLLAILKAGGAYVPLDPTYPPERLNYMLIDAQIMLIITQEQLHTRLHLTETVAEIIVYKASATSTLAQAPSIQIDTHNLAYMIYTSGSTGKPKGVMNSHQGLCNRLLWMQKAYQLTSQDRVLQKTPFGFDVSVWEFFWPLLNGASLVVAQPAGHQDPAYLKALIQEEAISTLHFVPSMLQVFLMEPDINTCSSLRQVICSGEALQPELQAQFFTLFPAQVQLYNLYGPTEAAIDVTHWTCSPNQTRISIGHPIANTQIYLLDSDFHPVPIGVAGELYIGGTNLARGYFQRFSLTAEKFLPNPLSNEPGARLYRTGDLARYDTDGSIEYLGRIDHQVKLRGFRIELGEIEAVFREHTEIKDALVLLDEANAMGPTLIAYITPRHTTITASTEQLHAYLRRFLPDYMVPHVIMTLTSFPLSAHGKIDRQALPSPDSQRRVAETTFIPPQTPIQKQLAEIWCQLLSLPRVSLQDNFFELGGHSLLLTKLAMRIRSTFEATIPLRDLFEAPSIEGMALRIEQIQNDIITQADDEKLMQILASLEALPDDMI